MPSPPQFSWLNPLPAEAYEPLTGWETQPVITPSALRAWRLRMRQQRLLTTGALSSRHHGSGMTAGEARAYVPGDDPRLMDWALLARTTHAYVRPPQHEPDEGVVLVIDASTPMAFGDDTSKLLWAAEWVCWLSAWLISQQFRTDVFLWQPNCTHQPWQHWRHEQRSKTHIPIQALIQWLYESLQHAEIRGWKAQQEPLTPWMPLASLQPVLKPYRHAVMISDFSPHMNADSPIAHWLDAMGPLCRRHRWHMVQVQHPLEQALPSSMGELPVKAMQGNDAAPIVRSMNAPSQLRTAFAAQQQQRQQQLAQALSSAGFAITTVSTQDSPQDSLHAVLEWVR